MSACLAMAFLVRLTRVRATWCLAGSEFALETWDVRRACRDDRFWIYRPSLEIADLCEKSAPTCTTFNGGTGFDTSR